MSAIWDSFADTSLAEQCSTGLPADHSRKCWISILPDELLYQIFGYIPQTDRFPMSRERGRLGPGLVCKRWWNVYEPLLFNEISFREASRNPELFERITEILKAKPHLVGHVKVVDIKIPKFTENIDSEKLRKISNFVNCAKAFEPFVFGTISKIIATTALYILFGLFQDSRTSQSRTTLSLW